MAKRTCRCVKKGGGFTRCRKGAHQKKVCYRIKRHRSR